MPAADLVQLELMEARMTLPPLPNPSPVLVFLALFAALAALILYLVIGATL